jgi:hypothetical protein
LRELCGWLLGWVAQLLREKEEGHRRTSRRWAASKLGPERMGGFRDKVWVLGKRFKQIEFKFEFESQQPK